MAKHSSEAEKRVKLLVGIINRNDVTAMTEACNECCVSLHFSGIGYGTAKSNYMSYLGIDEIEKRVVYSLIPEYCEKSVLRAVNKRLRLYLTGNGIAFTVPLSGVSNLIENAILSTPYREESSPESGKNQKNKESTVMHEMIVAVVNQKYTDAALDSARAAGATGATLLHTRSVNNKQVEQQLGTTFKQETDTICILTSHEFKHRILDAIRESAGLKTDGGAVLFSLPVDSLVGIGRTAADDE